MEKFALAAILSAAVSLSSFAGIHKVPGNDPVATVTIPDDWATVVTEDGIEATSKDGEVSLAIEEMDGDSVKQSLERTLQYLKSKGVTVTESSMKQEEDKLGDMDVMDISWDGKDGDKPAKISLTVAAVTKTKSLLLIYWASAAGEKKNLETLEAIAKSITKA